MGKGDMDELDTVKISDFFNQLVFKIEISERTQKQLDIYLATTGGGTITSLWFSRPRKLDAMRRASKVLSRDTGVQTLGRRASSRDRDRGAPTPGP